MDASTKRMLLLASLSLWSVAGHATWDHWGWASISDEGFDNTQKNLQLCQQSTVIQACALVEYSTSPAGTIFRIMRLVDAEPPQNCTQTGSCDNNNNSDNPSSCNPIVFSNGKKYLDEVDYAATWLGQSFVVGRYFSYLPDTRKFYRDNWSLTLGDVTIEMGDSGSGSTIDFTPAKDALEIPDLYDFLNNTSGSNGSISIYPSTRSVDIDGDGVSELVENYYPVDIKLKGKKHRVLAYGDNQLNTDNRTTIKINRNWQAGNDIWSITRPDGSRLEINSQGQVERAISSGGIILNFNITDSIYGYKDVVIFDDTGNQVSFTWHSSDHAKFIGLDGEEIDYYFKDEPDGTSTLSVIYPDETPTDQSDNPSKVYVHQHPEDANGLPLPTYGSLLEQQDNGVTRVRYEYDDNTGFPEHESMDNGVASLDIQYTLSGYGKVTEAITTNALGKQARYQFTDIGGAQSPTIVDGIASTSCLASNTAYTYDNNGYVLTETNSSGVVTESVRDEQGNITRYREGLYWSSGVGSTLLESADMTRIDTFWHANFTKPIHRIFSEKVNGTWKGMYREEWAYDDHARELSYSISDLTSHDQPYSTFGRLRTTTTNYTFHDQEESLVKTRTVNGPLDPANQYDGVDDITIYTYNILGQLTQVENAYGHSVTYSDYLKRGVPQTITDVNGQVTRLAYDPRGYLTEIRRETSLGDAVTQYDYYPSGQLEKVTLPDGSFLKYEYNTAQQLTALTNNLGERIEHAPSVLDGKWTSLSVKDSMGQILQTQSRVEDELGRIKQILMADGTVNSENFYDPDAKLASRESLKGKMNLPPRKVEENFAYDVLGRLSETLDTMYASTQFDYEGAIEISSVTDARGNTTTYKRDGFGNVIEQVSPDTGTAQFWYNENGQISRKLDARDMVVTYAYDALGRLVKVEYPSDSSLDISYQYDLLSVQGELSFGVGRLSAVLRENANQYFVYDDRGNMIANLHEINGIEYATRYDYNSASQLVSMTYPSGRVVGFKYDILGRTSQISLNNGGPGAPIVAIDDTVYRPFGPIKSFAYGNGIQNASDYDPDGRVISIVDAGMTDVLNLSYEYDWAGNISSLIDGIDSSHSQSFSYDDMDRLNCASGGFGSQCYYYDSVGNRTVSYEDSGQGQLVDILTMDDSSNQIESILHYVNGSVVGQSAFLFTDSGNTLLDSDRVYFYNAEDRLEGISSSNVVVLFSYNALGQRISKSPGGVPQNEIHFHYDRNGKLIGESDSQGNPIREYIWLDDTPVVMVGGEVQSSSIYYVHNNHIQTPQVLTDSSANTVWRGQYNPFGEVDVEVYVVENPLRFPGQYFDREVGLNFNYSRYYDVGLGRYVEADLFGVLMDLSDPQRVVSGESGIQIPQVENNYVNHLYGYSIQNPLSNIDPSGERWQGVVAGAIANGSVAYLSGGDAKEVCTAVFFGAVGGAWITAAGPMVGWSAVSAYVRGVGYSTIGGVLGSKE